MYAFPASVPQCAARFGSFDDFENGLPIADMAECLPHKPNVRDIGLLAGALVANQSGWAAVETIRPGDLVLTFDHGMQPVLETRNIQLRRPAMPGGTSFTMFFPKGAIGNRADVQVMPMQEVIFESDKAESLYGDPFVLMPALMLEGYNGICRQEIADEICVTVLVFAAEEIVHTNGGMLTLAPHNRHADAVGKEQSALGLVYPRLNMAQIRLLADWRAADRSSAQPVTGQGLFAS
jgi:hypothetical protein